MHIFLRWPDSPSSRCLDLQDDISVAGLKALIASHTGVPVEQQRLDHGGRHLVNDQDSLSAHGIGDDSTVRMLLRLRGGQMSVHVKIMGGKSVAISVSGGEATVAEVQSKLQEAEGLESGKYDLLFCGQHLQADRTLASYQIGADSRLDVGLLTSAPRPKGRCAVGECTDRVAKVVGDCRYCGLGYCSRHRLPESHACDNIQSCRQASYDKNTNKLMGEKCVGDKL